MRGGRFSRGWELTKKSWAVLRADRSLMAFPVVSLIAGLGALVVIMGPGVAAYSAAGDAEWVLVAFGVLAAYALTFVAIFSQVALAACADRALRGEQTTVGEGLRAAGARLRPILGWSLVQATVGLALSALREAGGADGILGSLLSVVADAAWAVVTFFVVPLLVLEGLGPIAAIKRSGGLVRERWGEGVVGSAATGAVVLIAALPAAALIALGFVAGGPAGVALVAVGVVVLAVAILVGSTLNAVFRVALYRWATTGEAVGGFAPGELEGAFKPKRRGRRDRRGATA
jgi:hypothetical protein